MVQFPRGAKPADKLCQRFTRCLLNTLTSEEIEAIIARLQKRVMDRAFGLFLKVHRKELSKIAALRKDEQQFRCLTKTQILTKLAWNDWSRNVTAKEKHFIEAAMDCTS